MVIPGERILSRQTRREVFFMKNAMVRVGPPLLIALDAGCTTTGTGFGSAPFGALPLYMLKAVMDGGATDIIELASSNVLR
jgi:hypothetical protein